MRTMRDPRKELFILNCNHWSATGEGEPYQLFSASGKDSTWHLNARHAWSDLDQIQLKAIKDERLNGQ